MLYTQSCVSIIAYQLKFYLHRVYSLIITVPFWTVFRKFKVRRKNGFLPNRRYANADLNK